MKSCNLPCIVRLYEVVVTMRIVRWEKSGLLHVKQNKSLWKYVQVSSSCSLSSILAIYVVCTEAVVLQCGVSKNTGL